MLNYKIHIILRKNIKRLKNSSRFLAAKTILKMSFHFFLIFSLVFILCLLVTEVTHSSVKKGSKQESYANPLYIFILLDLQYWKCSLHCNTTQVLVSSPFRISLICPPRTPRIFDNPVIFSIFIHSITNYRVEKQKFSSRQNWPTSGALCLKLCFVCVSYPPDALKWSLLGLNKHKIG